MMERWTRGELWNYRPHTKRKKQPSKKPLPERLARLVLGDIKRKRKAEAIRTHYSALQADGMSAADALDTVADALRQMYTGPTFKTERRGFSVYPLLLNAALESIDYMQVARAVLMIQDTRTPTPA